MSRAFYCTTPIYYVNAEPHIGHTYTTVVADTLARYHRLCGENTFLLTGTDEHGEKMLEVARERGISAQEVADLYSGIFRDCWAELGISHDRFIRTTDPEHEPVVKSILQRIYDEGGIEFREYAGDYCVGCERFLTERDLENGLCKDHERAPEKRTESNYFFKMSDHFAWLEEYIQANPDFIRPERYRNEVLGMLRDDSGLGDLCISRPKTRLEWGIELPFDEGYVCYVWFDALINYLTGIEYPDGPDFETYWAACEHLIGKDILKPHAIFWPTMLRAIGLAPMQHLNVHGYWNVDARKISKSLGNMVSPLAMKERYGFDAFRYFLLREMVFGLDANFSEEALVTRINADLANNLGNLLSRTLNMSKRFADARVPEPGPSEEPEREVEAIAAAAPAAVDAHMRSLEPHRALETIFKIVDAANRYLEIREPWKAAKDPALAERVRTTLFTSAEALRVSAVLLLPFIPDKASEILRRLGLGDGIDALRLPAAAAWGQSVPGTVLETGGALFPRIELPETSEDSG